MSTAHPNSAQGVDADLWGGLSPAEIIRRTRCEADNKLGPADPGSWRACCDTILRRFAVAALSPAQPQDAAPALGEEVRDVLREARSGLCAFAGGPDGSCGRTIAKIDALLSPAQVAPGDGSGERGPDLGAPTREPAVRQLALNYYRQIFSLDEAASLAKRYVAGLAITPASAGDGDLRAADELTIDEARRRALRHIKANGWEANSRFNVHSVSQLMADFGMSLLADPPKDRCAHPDCGCDPDAVCGDLLARPAPQAPAASAGRDGFELKVHRDARKGHKLRDTIFLALAEHQKRKTGYQYLTGRTAEDLAGIADAIVAALAPTAKPDPNPYDGVRMGEAWEVYSEGDDWRRMPRLEAVPHAFAAAYYAGIDAILAARPVAEGVAGEDRIPQSAFVRGTRVRKISGSSWHGTVCGHYSTDLTPDGVCVESEREPGSVQLYPTKALMPATDPATPSEGEQV